MSGRQQKYPRSFCGRNYRPGFENPVVEELCCQIDRIWEEADLPREDLLFFMSEYQSLDIASKVLVKGRELPWTSLRPETPFAPGQCVVMGDLVDRAEYAAGYIRRMEEHVDRLLEKHFGECSTRDF